MGNCSFDQKTLHAQLLELLHEFRRFGMTETGGVTRLAASDEEKEARDHLCVWLKNHGFTVLIDPIGNIFGVLDFGLRDNCRAFYCGSHLDSQPEGGHFDGVLGVVCACISSLFLKAKIERGELEPAYRYFVVACWTGEEGARFQPSLIGSSVFTGRLALDKAWDLQDSNQIQLKQALIESGYLGTDKPPPPEHYLELHIEQGSFLERSGNEIGLIEACWGAEKIRLSVTGKADHTGPTPMEERRDALLAASLLVVEIKRIYTASEDVLHTSIGRMTLHPNSPNTVVDNAELWIEFRSTSSAALLFAIRKLETRLLAIADQTGCTLGITNRETRNVTKFDAVALDLAAQALDETKTPYQRLETIAGHDAICLQDICPSTLLFAPSKDGITHSPFEFTSDEDVCAAFDGMTIALSAIVTRTGNAS